jgi:quercetin dioxygenase-like cupin family protein
VTETRYFPGSDQRIEIVLDAAATEGSLTLLRLHLPAGASAGPHRHRREAETLVVRTGEMWVEVGGERETLRAGDAVHLHRGSLHAFGSRSGAVVDIVATPAGLEEFFRVLCPADPAAPPPDEDAVRAAVEQAGLDFSGS